MLFPYCSATPLPSAMKAILAATLVLIAAVSSLSAQNNQPQTPTSTTNPDEVESNPRFWQATFANGGHYLVKLDRISTASKHEYIGNGAARVVEVTIGCDTAVVARFYFLEPVGKDSGVAAANLAINRAE